MPTARRAPSIVVLGGPNGAGKSTAAPRLLCGSLRVDEFVNADTLAQGLSAFSPEAAALEAGRVMLRRLDQLARGACTMHRLRLDPFLSPLAGRAAGDVF